MNEIVPIDPNILAMLKSSFGKDGLPLPFVREIFLLDCHAAGTSYLELAEVEPTLSPKDTLVLRREPDNPHDALAIAIIDAAGHKLGYIPRERNEVLARLLDAGKLVFGILEQKEWQKKWLKLSVRVFMRDM